jgi:hypothetical protein
MAENQGGAEVRVNNTPLDEMVKVIIPRGQGVTYGDTVYPLDEENEAEMDLATALELERLGFIKRA